MRLKGTFTMSTNRLWALLNPERGNQVSEPAPDLSGFIVNPFAAALTPAATMMYQAAYAKAQQDLEGPEWPMADCWN